MLSPVAGIATLAEVFRELNELKANGVVRDYAIGGATAALFTLSRLEHTMSTSLS
jgi:hypothetical protein